MILINGKEWDIRLVYPTHDKLQRDDGFYTIASCDNLHQTIYISEELKGYRLRKALIHETTHAYIYSYNIDLTDYEEEKLINILTNFGTDIINLAESLL